MSENDRIEAMRAAGTISDVEAERLIKVLRDLSSLPASIGGNPDARPAPATPPAPRASATPSAPSAPVPSADGVDWDARSEARDELRRVAREARDQARAAARSAGADAFDAVRIATDRVREGVEQLRETWATPAAGGSKVEPAGDAAAQEPIVLAPEGTRWLRSELAAGDLDLIAADVDAPTLDDDDDGDGRVRLEATADGARLFTDPQRGFLGRYTPVDARVRVPRAWGVDLDVKAGDLEVRDVPFVRGRVLAGDIELRGARGIDLTCLAGDVSIAIAPVEGRHRLVVRAGDVDVRLLPGSDVAVDGRVSVGDASARGLERERRGLGAVVHGRIGSGRAQLSIEIGAGDLDVRAEGRER